MRAWFLQEDLAAKSRNLLSLKIRQGEGGKTHTYSTKPMKLVLSLSTSFQYSNLPKKYCKSFIFKFISFLYLAYFPKGHERNRKDCIVVVFYNT